MEVEAATTQDSPEVGAGLSLLVSWLVTAWEEADSVYNGLVP